MELLEKILEVLGALALFLGGWLLIKFIISPLWNKNNELKYWEYKHYYVPTEVKTDNFIDNTTYVFPVSHTKDDGYVLLDFNYTPCLIIRLPYLNIEVKDDSLCIHSINYISKTGERVHFNEWIKIKDIKCTEEECYEDVFDPSFHLFPEDKWIKMRVGWNEWKTASFDTDSFNKLMIHKKTMGNEWCCTVYADNLWICYNGDLNIHCAQQEWERKHSLDDFINKKKELQKKDIQHQP